MPVTSKSNLALFFTNLIKLFYPDTVIINVGIFIFKNEEFTHTKIKLEKIDADMYWCDALGQSFGIRK